MKLGQAEWDAGGRWVAQGSTLQQHDLGAVITATEARPPQPTTLSPVLQQGVTKEQIQLGSSKVSDAPPAGAGPEMLTQHGALAA